MNCHFSLLPRDACRRRCGPPACLLLLLPLLAGCSRQEYEVVPVSGRVTVDGKPVPDVGIVFVPLAKGRDKPNIGPGSLGRTDTDGRFTLQTVDGDKGAVPTEHVVRMALAPNQGDLDSPEGLAPEGSNVPRSAPRQSALPRQAQDGSLRFEVPPQGTDQANFDFVSS